MWFRFVPESACSPRAQVQLIALARASWRFPRMAWLAVFMRGERKLLVQMMPGLTLLPALNYRDNHVRYSGVIGCGTAVYRVEWSDTGPFLPRHTVAYCCIPW